MGIETRRGAGCVTMAIPSLTPSLARADVLVIAIVHEGSLAREQTEYLFAGRHDVFFQDPCHEITVQVP